MPVNKTDVNNSISPVCLSFDSGGSSSRAILFNDEGFLGYGESGGTNIIFTSFEDCRQNIINCLEQAIANIPIPIIDTLYAVMVGPHDILEEELTKRVTVKSIQFFPEGYACLVSGAMKTSGIVALSGTGSTSYYIKDKDNIATIGGFGSILGDIGSGVWIGQQALRKAIIYGEGYGESTIFLEMILEKWNIRNYRGLIDAVYGTPAPFRKVASAVPIVAEAALKDDDMCRSLFIEAGISIAEQTLALIKKSDPIMQDMICTCNGGTWKAHPLMYESFCRAMKTGAPDIVVQKPLFDPVMAGVITQMHIAGNSYVQEIINDNDSKPDKMIDLITEKYKQFRVNW